MDNPRESMNSFLTCALNTLRRGDTNGGLAELTKALQELSVRLEAVEDQVGVSYSNANRPNRNQPKCP